MIRTAPKGRSRQNNFQKIIEYFSNHMGKNIRETEVTSLLQLGLKTEAV